MLIAADGVRSTVRRQMFPDVDLVYAGYIAWRGMVEEAALTPAAHAAIFHRFGWGLLDGEHILGYPVPGALDDLTPGRRRYSFVWYRPVDAATLAEMQTDATGRVHSEGIPPHLIRPEVIAALRRDSEALLPPVFAEIVRTSAQPLFQPIGDLESPMMRSGRVALLGDAAFVARPHVAKGAIKAGHDAVELAAALVGGDVEDGLARYMRCAARRARWSSLSLVGSGPTSKARGSAPQIPPHSCARMAASRRQTGPTGASSSDCWRKPASPDRCAGSLDGSSGASWKSPFAFRRERQRLSRPWGGVGTRSECKLYRPPRPGLAVRSSGRARALSRRSGLAAFSVAG